MDSMTLFIASLAVSCIGALASVLLIKADNAAKTAGCLIGAVAAVLSFIAGLEAVLGDVSSLNTVFFFPFARLELLLNGLAGLIVVLISILAFAGFIYGLSYFDEYPGKVGRAGFFVSAPLKLCDRLRAGLKYLLLAKPVHGLDDHRLLHFCSSRTLL